MADGLVLYGNRASSNAYKARFLLAELGIAFRSVEIPLTGVKPGWYGDLHPFGTVPTLVDGDVVIVESNTILRYLADREGRDDLYPRTPAARARVDQLLDALSLSLRPALWEFEVRTHYADDPHHSPRQPTPEEIATASEGLAEILGGWERLIEPDGYCTGTFSIADIAAAARMYLLPGLPFDLSRFPKTERMLDVIGARHAFRVASPRG